MIRIRKIGAPFLLLASCALPPKKPTDSTQLTPQPNQDAVAIVLEQEQEAPKTPVEEKKTAAEIEQLTIDEVIRIEEPNTQNIYDNSRYDFPITVNSRVEGWIDYFTGRGRGHFERYLARSSRYIPMMREVLKKEGLPEDLVYLALIESGFNTHARSRARAVGPWQFIKGTGKRYGLKVDAWIDERRDPVRSTVAAAKYLKDLYLMFESWYLAASAYNAGEARVLRAIETHKTNNYWRLCQNNALRRETRDYIPKLVAAAIIAKNPKKYGFEDVSYQEPFVFDSVQISFPVHLREISKLVDSSEEDLSDLNPELRRNTIPPQTVPYSLRIPPGTEVLVTRALAARRSEIETPEIPSQYSVKPGDTLGAIARRFGVSQNALANFNNLSRREKLDPGQNLLLPKRERTTPPLVASRTPNTGSEGAFIIHVVRKGESLWSISEKYNVTVSELFRWNNLRRSRIWPGIKLKVQRRTTGEESEDA